MVSSLKENLAPWRGWANSPQLWSSMSPSSGSQQTKEIFKNSVHEEKGNKSSVPCYYLFFGFRTGALFSLSHIDEYISRRSVAPPTPQDHGYFRRHFILASQRINLPSSFCSSCTYSSPELCSAVSLGDERHRFPELLGSPRSVSAAQILTVEHPWAAGSVGKERGGDESYSLQCIYNLVLKARMAVFK